MAGCIATKSVRAGMQRPCSRRLLAGEVASLGLCGGNFDNPRHDGSPKMQKTLNRLEPPPSALCRAGLHGNIDHSSLERSAACMDGHDNSFCCWSCIGCGPWLATEHTTRPLFVTQRGYIRLLDNALVLASAASMSSNSSRG